MRRLLTTLMILLVVLVAGFSALVLLVNPNDFRSYMVRQVEVRSGYKLELDGPLRWHVWPQLSILSGRMSLTAPGAIKPLISADNMRLDVALLPLISHQLQVREVMLKGAVIQLTTQSEAHYSDNVPIVPSGSASLPGSPQGWHFDIAKLKIADSVLVFQHGDNEQITARNINLEMEQDDKKQAVVDFSGRINRDQRDLMLSFSASFAAGELPGRLNANISDLTYQLTGADLPENGIEGHGNMQLHWEKAKNLFSIDSLQFSANDSDLQGTMSMLQGPQPQWAVSLQAENLNLDKLIVRKDISTNDSAHGVLPNRRSDEIKGGHPRPVIAASVADATAYNLQGFNARVAINAKNLRWRGLLFGNVTAAITNQNGLLMISTLEGYLGQGHIALPGRLDARKSVPEFLFSPTVSNVEIAPILTAFNYPIPLSGRLSMKGEFSGDKLDADAFRRSWQGNAEITMSDSKLGGINFQQLIQRAVERNSNDVKAKENIDDVTALEHFSAVATLNSGMLALTRMSGNSKMLSLSGQGSLDLKNSVCDAQFNVKVIDGWEGDSKVIAILKETAVPLRVYGPWQKLSYNLPIDHLMRKQLQDEAKRRLKEWAKRNKDKQSAKDVKTLLEKK